MGSGVDFGPSHAVWGSEHQGHGAFSLLKLQVNVLFVDWVYKRCWVGAVVWLGFVCPVALAAEKAVLS